MSRAYDWGYYAHKFIVDGMTLEGVASLPDAPAFGTIKNRCGTEKWLLQREALRVQTVARTREVTATTESDVSARHVKIAQALQSKALQALQKLDVDKLKPTEIREFLATATDIERKALGMDNKFTRKGVGDVTKLSDTDLLALARRAGIIGDVEAATLSA